ncbi:unnamed protein product [Heligmosomoides polygyrus]|uniref:5-hydroxyisourate hydrolase n=1 Tax=Heligmosomoides polygyrus TaxID=6339 RepID=A0A183FY31_HELPZ|nr:unnamed protein product [Heligmosomoides polygyrus]
MDTFSLFVFLCMILSALLQPPTASISSHVLDISNGEPAEGVTILAFVESTQGWLQIGNQTTTSDGRVPWVSPNHQLTVANYKLQFLTGDYFGRRNQSTFYPYVEVVFSVTDSARHNHVPLTLSPYGYSTYRGS